MKIDFINLKILNNVIIINVFIRHHYIKEKVFKILSTFI